MLEDSNRTDRASTVSDNIMRNKRKTGWFEGMAAPEHTQFADTPRVQGLVSAPPAYVVSIHANEIIGVE